jgi:hypothetical protein
MVITQNGIEWRMYNNVLMPYVPPHVPVNPGESEISELLKRSGAYMLRWISDWGSQESEFWYIIKDTFGGMDELTCKVRNNVRRGFKKCEVMQLDAAFLAENAYGVYVRAFERYKKNPLPEKEFKNELYKLGKEPGREFWGVFAKQERKLIAYTQCRIHGNVCHYLATRYDPRFFNLLPSYAKIYAMNEYYLKENKLLYISNGARPIEHQTNVQEFLINNFNFRKVYCRLNLAYDFKFKIAVNLLYPFRKIFEKSSHNIARKIEVFLLQEAIRRSYE